jgi:hypothetical protein
MKTATLITVALLAPFWWGMGLLLLALIGDLSRSARPRVSRLLERLEGTRPEPRAPAEIPERYAA